MQVNTELVTFLDVLADAAETAILPHFRLPLSVDNKLSQGFDPVTIADQAGEIEMRRLIKSHYPDHGILGEEYGSERLDAEHVWVLDPIDGTRAFISGLPTWGTLIGLKRDQKPSLGMMAQPYLGERFIGDGKTAWTAHKADGRARKQLTTRPCASLSDAVMFTTTPSLFTDEERPHYDKIEAATRLPRYGTDCYGYCMVAAGHADLVVEASLQPYDILALIPIIEGAGGVVTTWTGGSAAAGGRIIASGDPKLHDQALKELSRAA